MRIGDSTVTERVRIGTSDLYTEDDLTGEDDNTVRDYGRRPAGIIDIEIDAGAGYRDDANRLVDLLEDSIRNAVTKYHATTESEWHVPVIDKADPASEWDEVVEAVDAPEAIQKAIEQADRPVDVASSFVNTHILDGHLSDHASAEQANEKGSGE